MACYTVCCVHSTSILCLKNRKISCIAIVNKLLQVFYLLYKCINYLKISRNFIPYIPLICYNTVCVNNYKKSYDLFL